MSKIYRYWILLRDFAKQVRVWSFQGLRETSSRREEGPATNRLCGWLTKSTDFSLPITSHFAKALLSWGKALEKKWHSLLWVMKLPLTRTSWIEKFTSYEWNCEKQDLMKQPSWLVQGLELHSWMLTSSVWLQRTTEAGLYLTYSFLQKGLTRYVKLDLIRLGLAEPLAYTWLTFIFYLKRWHVF